MNLIRLCLHHKTYCYGKKIFPLERRSNNPEAFCPPHLTPLNLFLQFQLPRFPFKSSSHALVHGPCLRGGVSFNILPGKVTPARCLPSQRNKRLVFLKSLTQNQWLPIKAFSYISDRREYGLNQLEGQWTLSIRDHLRFWFVGQVMVGKGGPTCERERGVGAA